jgi:hypothetical protein
MWLFYFFCFGLIVFLILSFTAGLHKETKFRTKKALSSGWFLFITLLLLWSTGGNMHLIGKGLLLGVVLGVPLCMYEKRWIDKRIEGTTRKERLRHQSRTIPIIILFLCFWKQIVVPIWPSLGFFFALLTTQVYILFYTITLEKKLGTPILESEK